MARLSLDPGQQHLPGPESQSWQEPHFEGQSQYGQQAYLEGPSVYNQAHFGQPSPYGQQAQCGQPSQIAHQANYGQPSQISQQMQFHQPAGNASVSAQPVHGAQAPVGSKSGKHLRQQQQSDPMQADEESHFGTDIEEWSDPGELLPHKTLSIHVIPKDAMASYQWNAGPAKAERAHNADYTETEVIWV